MPRATFALDEGIEAEVQRLRREHPTFSESLQLLEWKLKEDPFAGNKLLGDGSYVYIQLPAPGLVGIRVAYTYETGRVTVVSISAIPRR